MQLQDALVKDALEAMFLAHVPLFVDYFESQVFVWCAGFESNDEGVSRIRDVLEVELWCIHLVVQVWVENVEFVSLDGFWWWVVSILHEVADEFSGVWSKSACGLEYVRDEVDV